MGVLHLLRSNLFDLCKISAVIGSLSGIFTSLRLSDVMPMLVPATMGYG
jgi:hypothetical protein